MLKVIVVGPRGKMGKLITQIAAGRDDMELVAGVGPKGRDYIGGDLGTAAMVGRELGVPVVDDLESVIEQCDVIIDFSFHAAIGDILSYAVGKQIPAVIATTGFTSDELSAIEDAQKSIPIFRSANMSLGVNLICQLAKKAAMLLPDFDIEIIEKHHNQKIDAPSGTAILLANEINDELSGKMSYEYDRHSKREKRSEREIGIHAVRGGTIVGEHEVIFAGRDEIISLTHSARSKEVFAVGAVNAAFFLSGKNSGLYSMKELVAEK